MDLDVLIMLAAFFPPGKGTLATRTSVSRVISKNVTFIHETFAAPPSMRAIIEVDVYYNNDFSRRYPIILGIYSRQDHVNIGKRCTYSKYGQFRNTDMHASISVNPGVSRFLKCDEERTGTVHCTGNITVQEFFPRMFSFSFGFNCGWIAPTVSLAGLIYNISFYGTNDTDCFKLETGDPCTRYIQYGMNFSLHGEYNNRSKDWFDFYLFKLLNYHATCYQHTQELLCGMLIPKCDPNSKQVIVPCSEMCHDFRTGCNNFNNYLNYLIPYDCNYLPSLSGNVPCFYESISC